MFGFRRLPKETLRVEAPSGVDGQGKILYHPPVEVKGRSVRKSDVVRGTGTEEVRTIASVWIDGCEPYLPDVETRVTTGDGLVGIVVERIDGRGLRNSRLDHVQLKLREE